MKRVLSFLIAVCMVLTLCPLNAFAADKYQNNDVKHVVIHDPSIVKSEDGVYYSVGSHMGMGKSKNLVNWTNLGFTMDGKTYLAPEGGSWKDTLAEPLEWCMRYQQAVPSKYYNDERKNTAFTAAVRYGAQPVRQYGFAFRIILKVPTNTLILLFRAA